MLTGSSGIEQMFKDALAAFGVGISVFGNTPPMDAGWREVKVGTGAPVVVGDRVTVHFLVATPTGEELANSRKRGLPYTLVVTAEPNDLLSRVVVGMRIGGSRFASLPPERAFGAAGLIPIVPPNATLEVTVNVVGVAGR